VWLYETVYHKGNSLAPQLIEGLRSIDDKALYVISGEIHPAYAPLISYYLVGREGLAIGYRSEIFYKNLLYGAVR
jgi:hypothetical protein